MSTKDPVVYGNEDITITIGPTGLTKVWAGQTPIGALEEIRICPVTDDIPIRHLEFKFPEIDPNESPQAAHIAELIEENKTKLAGFVQAVVVKSQVKKEPTVLIMNRHVDALQYPEGLEREKGDHSEGHKWRMTTKHCEPKEKGRPYCKICGAMPSFFELDRTDPSKTDLIKNGGWVLVEE